MTYCIVLWIYTDTRKGIQMSFVAYKYYIFRFKKIEKKKELYRSVEREVVMKHYTLLRK